MVLFDLSIGYQTGEMPANEWLRNIGIQLTIVDIFDRPSPFMVGARGNGAIRAFNEGLLGSAADVHAVADQGLVELAVADGGEAQASPPSAFWRRSPIVAGQRRDNVG